MNNHIELPITTSDGIFLAQYSGDGLAGLYFPHADGLVPPGRAYNSRQIPAQTLRWHRTTTDAVKAVLAGRKPKALPPLDWSGTTKFQQAVWHAMMKLGPGKTRSYGDIALKIGHPRSARAVGSACGSNPFPLIVPCHRILAANNKIGGYGSGLDWKYKLLAREGITF